MYSSYFKHLYCCRYRRYVVVPNLSRNVFFFVIVKLVFSLVLVQLVVRAYRRNLRLRGGRSPFRCDDYDVMMMIK